VNWPTDAHSAPAFRVALAVVLLGHAAALWQLASSQPSLKGGRPEGTAIILAKLLTVAERNQPADKSNSVSALALSSEFAAEPQRPMSAPAEIAELPISGRDRPPPGLAHASADEDPDAFLDYLPRDRLTVPPTPLTDVQVPFPEQVAGTVNLRVVASLFIDEFGKVRRVRLDSPGVPSAFAHVIIDTFLATRFKPAEIETAPVRSHVRLEIEFRTGAASR
jgi:periplasmic protein TonB